MGEIVELTVVEIGSRGWGIAGEAGRRVYVWGAVPGDRVSARIVSRRRGRVEARPVTFHEYGVPRVEAPCRHFSICGGCLWQDLAYDDQLRLKREIVRWCLRTTGLGDVQVAETLGSPEVMHYRNKVEFAFSRDASGELVTGLHVSRHRGGEAPSERVSQSLAGSPPVFEVERCELIPPEVNAAAVLTGKRLRQLGVLAYDPETRTGSVRSVAVRQSRADGALLVNLVTGVREADVAGAVAEALESGGGDGGIGVGRVVGVVQSWNPRRSRQAAPREQRVGAGEDRIVERIGGLEIEVSGTSFLQVNTLQAERLYSLALDEAGLTYNSQVLDLFSGTGALSLMAARRAKRVTGVELRDHAVADANRNAERNGIENAQFIVGDVQTALTGELADATFDTVLTNPPRAGVTRRAVKAVCEMGPARIVYVSCDPETLARDLKVFASSGYSVGTAYPVDMFPHTPHCEVVVRLTRNS